MTEEVWKIIEDYPNYMVSNHGRIMNIKRGRIMKLSPRNGKDGYPGTALRKDGKSHSIHVHRLVAIAFIPNPDSLPEINHIDEIKSHNYVENLEWVTYGQNVRHSIHKRCGIYNLINQDGKYITITNLKGFCRDNNLTRGNMMKVLDGTRNHHKGWRKA